MDGEADRSVGPRELQEGLQVVGGGDEVGGRGPATGGLVGGEQAVGLPRLDRGGVGGDARGGRGFVEVRARGEGVPRGTRRRGVKVMLMMLFLIQLVQV